jgi:hypothetical protein
MINDNIVLEEKNYLFNKYIKGIDVSIDTYPSINKRVLNFKKDENEKRNDTII